MSAKFPEKRDWYYVLPNPEGETYVKLPSVTSILSVISKPQLVYWAAKVTAEAILAEPERYNTVELAARVPYTLRDDAAERGKSVHKLIEEWALGGDLDLSHPYSRSLDGFLRAWRPEPIESELTVFSTRHGYAGTTDLVATIGDEVWIVDFKTSKHVYYEYHLQTEAYKQAEWAKFRDGTIGPKPKVDRTGVVLLREDGTHQFVETKGDFETFLLAKELFVRLRLREEVM